jgi:hypothetical protein
MVVAYAELVTLLLTLLLLEVWTSCVGLDCVLGPVVLDDSIDCAYGSRLTVIFAGLVCFSCLLWHF